MMFKGFATISPLVLWWLMHNPLSEVSETERLLMAGLGRRRFDVGDRCTVSYLSA